MDKYGVPVLKKILLLLLLSVTLFAQNPHNVEEKIYALIIHTLYPNKTYIKVFSDTPHYKEILQHISNIKLVSSPQDADFLVLENQLHTPSKGVIFATSYHLLRDYKKDAIGGFYWQKGRPNILFLRKNLQKYHISLPASMQKYVEDELWNIQKHFMAPFLSL